MRFTAALLSVVLAMLGPAEAAGLPVQSVVIQSRNGPHAFRMEIAADDASRERGLMFRTHLARNAGMLFDFRTTVMTAFWMKDTPLPLDMLFVRSDGTISTVAANAVPYSTIPISSAEPVRAVIEINGGLAKSLDIEPGDRVTAAIFPKPRHASVR